MEPIGRPPLKHWSKINQAVEHPSKDRVYDFESESLFSQRPDLVQN